MRFDMNSIVPQMRVSYNDSVLQLFAFLSAVCSILPYILYFRDIFRKKTKPERASWLIWSVLGSIAFFSQLAKGATYSLWMPGLGTIGVMTTFFLALRYGTGGVQKRDVVALTIAALGLLVWYFTKEAALALFIVIGIDAVGSYLTTIKGYEDPESETLTSWIIFSFSGLFSALSVGSFNLILLSYPLYISFANAAIVTAIVLGKRRKKINVSNISRLTL